MRKTAVIMAGGRGERFWPQSRSSMPKQFLSLTSDGKTMIQLTVERLKGLVEPEDIYIATNGMYKEIVKEQLPTVPEKNILFEPAPKNTAPCIAFAAAVIAARHQDAVMIVLPSDHIITNTPLFVETFSAAAQVAQAGENLVTVGVAPTFPETGYGYIKMAAAVQQKGVEQKVYEVEKFVEKPDLETAKQYLLDGNYLWNSGMFTWKVSSFYKNLEEFLPGVHAMAKNIEKAVDTDSFTQTVKTEFEKCEPVSVDYGIMEKAPRVYTVPASFGWDDVGSWLSLERINPQDAQGNVVKGNVLLTNASNNIFVTDEKLIAAVGLQNTIVVNTENAVLVCAKENAQDVKKIVEQLKQNRMDEYL